jgi:DNA polymerase-3 subunit alpha
VTGLGAIDGLGAVALANITANQPYRSFEDFLLKNPKKVNKNHIIALAKAGAFDSLGVSRKYIADNWEAIKEALKKSIKAAGEAAVMNGELLVDVILENFSHSIGNPQEEWTLAQKLEYEKEVLGEYVSGGAKDLYPEFFKGGKYNTSFETLALRNKGDAMLFEGIVNSISTFEIKRGASKGKTMGRVVIENLKGETADIVVFAQVWEKHGKKLAVNKPVIGEINVLEDKASKEKSWSLEKVLATLPAGKNQ